MSICQYFFCYESKYGNDIFKDEFWEKPGIMKIQLEREYFMLEKRNCKNVVYMEVYIASGNSNCNNKEEGEYGWKLYMT